ncbi:MAG: 16S rRNA (cytidine(1402)-2'-O)-methyltransferase [Myxococcota bacterium]
MALVVVGTPIGHLGDLSPRGVEALKNADVVACEDTRVTRKLLQTHGIDVPVSPYHAHSPPAVLQRLADRALAGDDVALVSDAGMPTLSDPGRELVATVRSRGGAVTVVPGPSALTTALAACGLPTEPHLFLGFLPRQGKRRRQQIEWLAQLPVTGVLFESAQRLPKTLGELADRLGERPAAVARELTKRFEEVVVAPLPELAGHFLEPPKGEIVLVVGPGHSSPSEPGDELDESAWVAEAARGLALGMAPSQLAKDLANRSGSPRKKAYDWVMQAQRGDD